MKKLKISGSINTEDSLWLKLEGSIETLNNLDSIFNIYELVEFKAKSYKSWIKKKPTDFLIDEKYCLVYIVLNEKYVHLILRKVREYERVKETIFEYFKF